MSGKYDLDRDVYIRNLKSDVKDLEAQLTEKDKRIAKLREFLDTCEAAYERDMAEKDAEIQRLKDALSILQTRPQVER